MIQLSIQIAGILPFPSIKCLSALIRNMAVSHFWLELHLSNRSINEFIMTQTALVSLLSLYNAFSKAKTQWCHNLLGILAKNRSPVAFEASFVDRIESMFRDCYMRRVLLIIHSILIGFDRLYSRHAAHTSLKPTRCLRWLVIPVIVTGVKIFRD